MAGKLITISGDVTKYIPQFGEKRVVIPHVANNLGIFGSGVALAIKRKWPRAFDDYLECYDEYKENSLGKAVITYIDDYVNVANMIAQNNLISKNNPRPLNYRALTMCMNQVYKYTRDCNDYSHTVIHTPEFGGLRAGGNFDFILNLIEDFWIKRNIDVVIYKYEE